MRQHIARLARYSSVSDMFPRGGRLQHGECLGLSGSTKRPFLSTIFSAIRLASPTRAQEPAARAAPLPPLYWIGSRISICLRQSICELASNLGSDVNRRAVWPPIGVQGLDAERRQYSEPKHSQTLPPAGQSPEHRVERRIAHPVVCPCGAARNISGIPWSVFARIADYPRRTVALMRHFRTSSGAGRRDCTVDSLIA